MTKKKSAIKKKHRRMMEKRAENRQKILEARIIRINSALTENVPIDERVHKLLHPDE